MKAQDNIPLGSIINKAPKHYTKNKYVLYIFGKQGDYNRPIPNKFNKQIAEEKLVGRLARLDKECRNLTVYTVTKKRLK